MSFQRGSVKYVQILFISRTNSKPVHTICATTGKAKHTTPFYSTLYAAMALRNAGSHPVNISEQKNITAERPVNCFPCLSLWDSILLFWRQGFRWHTASFSTFSTAVTSLPKFRGEKKLNPVKVSVSLRHIPGLELIQERVMFGILSGSAEICAKWTELLR